ncbi:hypothetical protein BD410DRAFT_794370 [Rickenella mellea]|uniref:Uncharacterized protein n=1 Tax=Rickenella mellea TaxID=50990 RepID=A0A4Y7PSC6_9AGAM|nr:hypothetical protein BD410DRAFT_794370 [Rickenella mellea]
MSIQIDVAELAGIVLEGILYGIFISLFVATMHILLTRKHHKSRPNIPMIIAAVVMFLLATVQISLDTTNVFRAFINLDRTQRLEFLTDPAKPIWAAKAATYFAMMIVGDIIGIYRTYIVWGRKFWVIFVPVCCTVGSAVASCQTIWTLRHLESVTVKEESKWGYAIFSLSLAANSIATALLAYKIWANEARINAVLSEDSKMGRFSNMIIVKVVLESGVINAAYLVTYIVILGCGSHGLEVLEFMSTPLVGIIFATVILRTSTAAQRSSMAAIGRRELSRLPFPQTVRTLRSEETSTATDLGSVVMDQKSLKV